MASMLSRAATCTIPLVAASLAATAVVLSLAIVLALASRSRLRRRQAQQRTAFLKCHLGLSTDQATATRIVGVFHPYWSVLLQLSLSLLLPPTSAHLPDPPSLARSNAGGGGERVLWTALACMQRELAATSTAFVVYTGDVGTHDGAVTKADILAKVEVRFPLRRSCAPSRAA